MVIRNMVIRNMVSADLSEIIKIHKEAFKGFFLTRMGSPFLRTYYQTVLDYKGSISIVAKDAETDCILGFAVGFGDPDEFYSLLAKRRTRMLPIIALALLRDPTLVPQVLRSKRRVEAEAQQPIDAVELSSIAVRAQGSGVGRGLLNSFINKARITGAQRLYLTTDAVGNGPVRRFYEVHGFTLQGYEARGDRKMCCYVKSLG